MCVCDCACVRRLQSAYRPTIYVQSFDLLYTCSHACSNIAAVAAEEEEEEEASVAMHARRASQVETAGSTAALSNLSDPDTWPLS